MIYLYYYVMMLAQDEKNRRTKKEKNRPMPLKGMGRASILEIVRWMNYINIKPMMFKT